MQGDREIKNLLKVYNSDLTDQFKKLAKPMESIYGFDYINYRWVSADGDFFHISTMPERAHYIFTDHLYKQCPFIHYPNNYSNGAYLVHSLYDINYIKTLEEHYNNKMPQSIIICKKRMDGIQVFTLGCTNINSPALAIAINNLNIFDKFCEYLITQWSSRFNKMEPFIINIKKIIGKEKFYNKPNFYQGTDIQSKQQFLKCIGYEEKYALEILEMTKRETECLRLIVEGHTVKKMARTLHISPRTLEIHIRNIKKKLHCNTRIDILIKVEYLKLIGLY